VTRPWLGRAKPNRSCLQSVSQRSMAPTAPCHWCSPARFNLHGRAAGMPARADHRPVAGPGPADPLVVCCRPSCRLTGHQQRRGASAPSPRLCWVDPTLQAARLKVSAADGRKPRLLLAHLAGQGGSPAAANEQERDCCGDHSSMIKQRCTFSACPELQLHPPAPAGMSQWPPGPGQPEPCCSCLGQGAALAWRGGEIDRQHSAAPAAS